MAFNLATRLSKSHKKPCPTTITGQFFLDSDCPAETGRVVASGAPFIERVDILVKLISHQAGAASPEIDRTVEIVDQKLNEKIVVGGSGAV